MNGDEGYGYEWDAMLVGGPADGCLDRTIVINGDKPPKTLIRVMDGQAMNRESLGEKLIERLTRYEMDGSQRVALYVLRGLDEQDRCIYDYEGSITMEKYRTDYDPD